MLAGRAYTKEHDVSRRMLAMRCPKWTVVLPGRQQVDVPRAIWSNRTVALFVDQGRALLTVGPPDIAPNEATGSQRRTWQRMKPALSTKKVGGKSEPRDGIVMPEAATSTGWAPWNGASVTVKISGLG